MKAILFFVTFVAATGTVVSGAGSKPLNILVLYADDWRHDTLGVAGNPVVQTPQLDRLAGEGIRFTQNCVTTSICGVSRASLFTGQWMSRHGCRGFTAVQDAVGGNLSRACCGSTATTSATSASGTTASSRRRTSTSAAPITAGTGMNAEDGSKIHVTQRNENDALEFLARAPEGQAVLPDRRLLRHPRRGRQPAAVPAAAGEHGALPGRHHPGAAERHRGIVEAPAVVSSTEKNEGRNRWHWRFDTPEKYQTMMKNYYRLATEVDATCGRVLAELEKQGVLDNTLVIFTTDNGYYHAEHGLADKWYPHQESIRVPLIIRDPRMPKAQAGHDQRRLHPERRPRPDHPRGGRDSRARRRMQGRDIAPLYLAEDKPEWRTEFFYEHPTLKNADFIPASEALVRKDWKYFYWPEQKVEQLFDLKADPREENDLAGDPAQAGRLAEMRERFAELKAAAK